MCYWHSVLYHYLKHRSFNLIVVPLSTLDLAWIHSCRSLYTRISQVADNELAAEIRVYYVRFTDELYKSYEMLIILLYKDARGGLRHMQDRRAGRRR